MRLPSTLKRIGHSTFRACENLKAIELPNGLEYIGVNCFSESELESIKIPPAVKTIEAWTFYQCESLKHVEFSEGLEHLGEFCFSRSGL